MTKDEIEMIRLELLRERVRVEGDIARSLWRILRLAEACIENSPWAQRIMTAVYMPDKEGRS